MNLYEIMKNWVLVRVLNQPTEGLYDEVDDRNFGAEVIEGEVTRADLTDEDFQTCNVDLIHQKTTDFCVGCSKAYGKQATEGVRMSWAGAFAMGCRARGHISGFGISILQVMRGSVKYGTPEEHLWPYKGSRNYSANWNNMSREVRENAAKHKDASFFMIKPNKDWDRFDQFRAYLHKLKDKKIIIQTGTHAHAVTLIGQKTINGELKLFGPDSYGDWNHNYIVGDAIDGYRYFSRREANYLFNGYIGLDIERSLAELLNRYNGKAVKLEDSKECYLVAEGKKRLLKNEAVAWSHNTLLFGEDFVFVLSEQEMDKIPTGLPAKFEEGENHEIIQRILEKVGKTDLIKE